MGFFYHSLLIFKFSTKSLQINVSAEVKELEFYVSLRNSIKSAKLLFTF